MASYPTFSRYQVEPVVFGFWWCLGNYKQVKAHWKWDSLKHVQLEWRKGKCDWLPIDIGSWKRCQIQDGTFFVVFLFLLVLSFFSLFFFSVSSLFLRMPKHTVSLWTWSWQFYCQFFSDMQMNLLFYEKTNTLKSKIMCVVRQGIRSGLISRILTEVCDDRLPKTSLQFSEYEWWLLLEIQTSSSLK